MNLRDFWLRRARRLLPALFVLLAVVTAWVTLADRSALASLRGAVAAAAAYVSNWYFIAQHSSYFARFAPPGPLDHLWSLAVEEQFYLAWPWLLLLGLCFLRGRRANELVRARRSGGWCAHSRARGRVHRGGARALPSWVRSHQGLRGNRHPRRWPPARCGAGDDLAQPPSARHLVASRLLLDTAGIAGLAMIVLMVWRVGQYSPFIYRGGLGLLSVATAAVVAAVVYPGSLLGLVLGWWPLRWLGVRSYGIYLWHYPVIVLTSPADSQENLARSGIQVAACVLLAALSWQFIEEPVRRGALGRLWARPACRGRASGPPGWAASPRWPPRPGSWRWPALA